jgi:hypothetical protein
MPRNGAIVLSDLSGDDLRIVCAPCGRSGRYLIAALIAARGDAQLPALLAALAGDCPRRAAFLYREPCQARFEFGSCGGPKTQKSPAPA